MSERIAVIGAGVTGLVAAYRLVLAGHRVDVYERWPGLGGMAATIDVGDDVLLERYYHHLFMSDHHIASLYDELGMPHELEWRPSRVAVFRNGVSYPLTTPLDVLRFRPMPFTSRLRMGFAVLWLQRRHTEVAAFESMTAAEWVRRSMGRHAYEQLWGPLLRAKFGARRAEEISMGWLWSKLTLRRQIQGEQARVELLGYPRASFERLFRTLVERIESAGGRVWIDRPAVRLGVRPDGGLLVTPGVDGSFRTGLDPRSYVPAGEPEPYDGVVATVPSDTFLSLLVPELADAVGAAYLDRVRAAEYQTALCLLLEVDRKVTAAYWTNVCDEDIPFIGIIEHTNFVEPERYGGRHFLYVANYLEPGDPLLELDVEGLLGVYDAGLKKMAPGWSRDWVNQAFRFVEPAAQPIITAGFREQRMPPLRTPVRGLVLANTQQVYPEDRGTNYAVRLGDEAADAVMSALGSGVR